MSSLRKSSRPRRCCAGCLGVVLVLGFAAAASGRETPASLNFQEALRIAEQEAPALRARRAALEAARQEIDPADALPDPEAFIGLNAVPIEGEERFQFDAEPMTMQTIGVRQAVPNRAKRSARRELAVAAAERSRAEREVVLAQLRRETAAAWIELYHAQQGLTLFDAWEADSRVLVQAVTSLIESGRARGSDALVARREALAVEELRDRQMARVAAARARLRAWVGEAADRELSGSPPSFELIANPQDRLDGHPELALYGSLAAQARARVDAAAAEKRPDWEVEVGYQRRPGFDDMIALQLKIDLPLFSGSRQDPLIEAERQRALQIDAQRAAAYREHAATLEADLADHDRWQREVDRLTGRTLPLMEELVSQRLAEYRSGEGALPELIRARLDLLQTRMDLLEARSARGRLAAAIRYAYLEEWK